MTHTYTFLIRTQNMKRTNEQKIDTNICDTVYPEISVIYPLLYLASSRLVTFPEFDIFTNQVLSDLELSQLSIPFHAMSLPGPFHPTLATAQALGCRSVTNKSSLDRLNCHMLYTSFVNPTVFVKMIH